MPINLAYFFELSYGHDPAWFSALWYYHSQVKRLRFLQFEWVLYGLITTETVIYVVTMLSASCGPAKRCRGSCCSQFLSTKWGLRLLPKKKIWAVRTCLNTSCSGNKERVLGTRKGCWPSFTVQASTFNITSILISGLTFRIDCRWCWSDTKQQFYPFQKEVSTLFQTLLAQNQPWRLLKLCWGLNSFFFFLSLFSCIHFSVTDTPSLWCIQGWDGILLTLGEI